jgi:octaprenyl-diphosphate synthase
MVEKQLRGLTKTSIPELDPLLDHVLTGSGKRVRAAITLLASALYPHDSDKPVTMAAAVELLHLATLIHDDTIDNTDLRRGKATVSNLWGKHMAVLLGDYVFAASATLVCDTNNVRVIRRFAETIMELASGEVMEYFHCYQPDQARHRYHDRIYRKTASLFCTAAETGAILGNAPEGQVQLLRDYGYNIGMAFQMVDDLLDVQGDTLALGKPVGNDLLHGVLTLPAIMLLERYPSDNPIEAFFRDRTQEDSLRRALDMINDGDIVADCYTVIREYCVAANRSLDFLPECPARRSLVQLADYIWERTR